MFKNLKKCFVFTVNIIVSSFILQVVLFMYLWSIDMEAVLVAMSCFALLCEEAEIRCGSDEVAVTCLLPNYHLYVELAQASNILTTGLYLYF